MKPLVKRVCVPWLQLECVLFRGDAGKAADEFLAHGGAVGVVRALHETASGAGKNGLLAVTFLAKSSGDCPLLYSRRWTRRALVHELVHVVAVLMRSRGLEDGEDSEARAYLTDWLFSEFECMCEDNLKKSSKRT